MEDLRIIAENMAQKNEIITMLIDIGYKRDLFLSCDSDDLMGIHVYSSGEIQDVLDEDYNDKRHKEITTQQLRDLVVLKRNDVKDATHECGTWHNRKGYLTSKKQEYYWAYADKCWKPTLSVYNFETLALKPIEKEMKTKEYLDKDYVLRSVKQTSSDNRVPDGWIEVPEGATTATFSYNYIIFWKDGANFVVGTDKDWYSNAMPLEQYLVGHKDNVKVVWQRHSQLADNKLTLNDQYAEIEQVRQGLKYDSDKPRYSLLPKGSVNAVIDVLEFGAKKYEAENWKKVDNAKERYYNAAMRHIDKWWNGEKHDPETNIHHLAHASTNLFFLMWFDK